MTSKNTCDTRILNKSLEDTLFLEKKINLVHRYEPHEARFCAAQFFSGTKNSVSRGLAVQPFVECLFTFRVGVHNFDYCLPNVACPRTSYDFDLSCPKKGHSKAAFVVSANLFLIEIQLQEWWLV